LVATTFDGNGGTLDDTIIGGSTPVAGSFTSLAATTATINSVVWNNAAGKIDGEQIADDTIDDDSIDFGDVDMDDMSDGSTNAAITLAQETQWGAAYTTVTTDIDQSVKQAATPTFAGINGHDEIRVLTYSFYDPECAASQSDIEFGVDPGTDVGGVLKQIVVPFDGSIIAITASTSGACTSGTLTANATINGSAQTFQVGLNSGADTLTSYTIQANDTTAVTAGQRVGAKITTDSDWSPTTSTVMINLILEH